MTGQCWSSFTIRSKFMGSAKLLGEVVRFDVRAVGLQPGIEAATGQPIMPSEWPAWCGANVEAILRAIYTFSYM